jgi:hypothetical protein
MFSKLVSKPHFVFIFIWLTLSACVTPAKKDFDKIQPGMYKFDVVDIMGVPDATYRRDGNDRWIFRYFENNQNMTKEVHFNESKVIYSGDPVKPEVSADEQDKRNEQANADLEKQYAQKRAEIRNHEMETPVSSSATDSNATVPQFTPIE